MLESAVLNRLPLLTSIDLETDSKSLSKALQMFSVAPRLWAVKISNVSMNLISLPMHQLVKLDMSTRNINECLDVLQSTPRLNEATISFEILHHTPRTSSMVVIPQSESLSLSMNRWSLHGFLLFLDALSLPSARTLKFQLQARTFPHTNFISLINRSSCSLTRLDLLSVDISDEHLIQCLHAVPLLRVLALQHEGTAAILRALNPEYATHFTYTEPVVPRLETFIYSTLEESLSSDRDIHEMLYSRWGRDGFTFLRFVTIINPRVYSTGNAQRNSCSR